ncbi:MAG: hypothetical protein JEY99_16240 [Spirochaetales bacterium]|nr:hypothetical protein [Spirochaetales bacterium]
MEGIEFNIAKVSIKKYKETTEGDLWDLIIDNSVYQEEGACSDNFPEDKLKALKDHFDGIESSNDTVLPKLKEGEIYIGFKEWLSGGLRNSETFGEVYDEDVFIAFYEEHRVGFPGAVIKLDLITCVVLNGEEVQVYFDSDGTEGIEYFIIEENGVVDI